jgi:hypothetical protein
MQLLMQSNSKAEALDAPKWDVALIGDIVDERGEASVVYVSSRAQDVLYVAYDARAMILKIDGEPVTADDVYDRLKYLSRSRVVLDATTLGIPDLLLTLNALREASSAGADIIYVEPASYAGPRRTDVMHRRDFELSDDMEGFLAIPGFSLGLHDPSPRKIVFFLGYEGQRLDQAFEQLNLRPRDCTVVFGVPAFRAGWDMDAFANNAPVMSERGVGGGVMFCGAENPAAAIELLEELHRTCQEGERFFIGPIGTKPHGVGVSIYACLNDSIGILYDHPKRRQKRSKGTGTWHLFSLRFDQ